MISEHVSTEALLRDESVRQTPLGAALRRSAKAHTAPADDTVLALLRRWYFARRSDSGFRLLGFPGNLRQSLVFDEWLESRGEILDAVVQFTTPDTRHSPVADHYRDYGLLVSATADSEPLPSCP